MRAVKRKIRGERNVVADPGYPTMGSRHYFERLPELHSEIQPRAYFEIGTESGASLSMARCPSVAVDPAFDLKPGALAGKSIIHLFQQTSDDFFASDALDQLGLTFDLAFLDGMHLFEFLLRDFINTEPRMSRNGIIVLHDCVPWNSQVAERTWDKSKTVSWTGDVWKLIPILLEWRPDLDVQVMPCTPTGLVEIRNLDPDNNVLTKAYDEIVARYIDLTLDSFGLAKFCDMCKLPPAKGQVSEEKSRLLAIKSSAPDAKERDHWGDFHFATGLAQAIEANSGGRWRTRVDTRDAWTTPSEGDQVDLVLRGHKAYQPQDSTPCLMWHIYPGKPPLQQQEIDLMDDLFVASPELAHQYQASFLPQAFDAAIMYPPKSDAPRTGLIFVGNNHFAKGKLRPIVQMAYDAQVPIKIWGRDWDDTPAQPDVVAPLIRNENLGELYRSASIVLCDHNKGMARAGFLSNRIFDALACAAPVISDPIDIPERFAPFVKTAGTPQEFAKAVEEIKGESPEMRADRHAFAVELAKDESFSARAKKIIAHADKALAARAQ